MFRIMDRDDPLQRKKSAGRAIPYTKRVVEKGMK
jgi:hypothetical protein